MASLQTLKSYEGSLRNDFSFIGHQGSFCNKAAGVWERDSNPGPHGILTQLTNTLSLESTK